MIENGNAVERRIGSLDVDDELAHLAPADPLIQLLAREKRVRRQQPLLDRKSVV